MAKPSTPAPKSKAVEINTEVLAGDIAAANQLAVLQTKALDGAMALAQQLGYEGVLTVGALEDGVRFYQRRSVEACLALGSCLLLLKEITMHGEFEQRIDGLGFSLSAAKRYMQAASKASKSPKLGDLSGRAKNFGAFLELLVLDDQVIDNLAEMDEFERMSASEVRAAARELKAEKEATDKVLADKNAKIDKLSRHIKRSTPDQVLAELQKEATALMNDALGCVRGQIRAAFAAITNHSEEDHSVFLAGIVGQLQADVTALREEFNLPDVSNAADQALAGEVAQWATPTKPTKK